MEVPQFDSPWASGFTTVETNGEALLALSFEPKVNLAPWRAGIVISSTKGMLKPGDEITLRLGDRRQGSPGIRAQTFPDSLHAFRVLADCMGMGRFLELEQETGVTIVAGPPCRAELIVPSRVSVGDAFDVKARVCDCWGNPSSSFTGTLSLLSTEGLAVEPHEPPISSWPGGVAVIGTATAERPGIFHVTATGDFEAESNPVVASVEEPSRSLFWSDMHGQTYCTAGTGSVAEFLSFARDSALMDVAAWQGNDFQIPPEGWREAQQEIKHFNEPGRFEPSWVTSIRLIDLSAETIMSTSQGIKDSSSAVLSRSLRGSPILLMNVSAPRTSSRSSEDVATSCSFHMSAGAPATSITLTANSCRHWRFARITADSHGLPWRQCVADS